LKPVWRANIQHALNPATWVKHGVFMFGNESISPFCLRGIIALFGAIGTTISGNPQALASALRKIEAYAKGLPPSTMEATPKRCK
jgi:hypothetical protein